MLPATITEICNTETIKFKSSLSFVMPIISTIVRDISSKNIINNPRSKELILILTELILNGIKHGNKNNYNKNITIIYSYDTTHLTISIEDEGNGFDYRKCSLSKKASGINLVRAIADDIYWNRKGNKVVVVLTIL